MLFIKYICYDDHIENKSLLMFKFLVKIYYKFVTLE